MPSRARGGRLPHWLSPLMRAGNMDYLKKAWTLSRGARETTSGSNCHLGQVLWGVGALGGWDKTWSPSSPMLKALCWASSGKHRGVTHASSPSRDSLAVARKLPWLMEQCWDIAVCKPGTGKCHHSLLERKETAKKETQILTRRLLWQLVSDWKKKLWLLEMGRKSLLTVSQAAVKKKD